MVRALFLFSLGSSLLLLLSGYLGTLRMVPSSLEKPSWRTATVTRASWPNVVLRSDAREWTIRLWSPIPSLTAGQTVDLAVDPVNDSKVYLDFPKYHPMNQIMLGFIVTILSIFGVAFTATSGSAVNPGAMPVFPVTLHAPYGKGLLFLGFGAFFFLWVLYSWLFPADGEPRFAFLADAFRIGFGALLCYIGLYFTSMRLVVTETEMVETSRAIDVRVELSRVKRIVLEPIRGSSNSRVSSSPPIIGWTINFEGDNGERLHTLSNDLVPEEEFQQVKNYLLTRFPVEKRED